MGSPTTEWGRIPDEELVRVDLTHPFEVQQVEVTQAQWAALGLPNPSGRAVADPEADARIQLSCMANDCPVDGVSWFEAIAYANLLSERHEPPLKPCYTLQGCTGNLGEQMQCETASLETPTVYECEGYRLPTHAEREYATRAGTSTALYNGELTEYASDYYCGPDANLEQIAWYCYNAGKLGRVSSQPVAQLAPNGFGLYDMLGNVAELGHDFQSWSTPPAGVNPRGAIESTRDLRHLYSCNASLQSQFCRASENLAAGWNESGRGVGFRLVRTLFE